VPSVGAGYVFSEPASGWTNAASNAKLTLAGGKTNDRVGSGVALSGNVFVLGATGHQAAEQSGIVDVFSVPRPAFMRLKQSHKSWILGSHAISVNPRHPRTTGTVFSYRLHNAARVTLRFSERKAGHTVSKGGFVLASQPGATKVYFDGLIGHRRLAPGTCTVTFSAVNAGGTATVKRLRFVVKAKKKH
jgi:hypothetical protein